MDRVSDTTKATDLFGSGKHGYTEALPSPTRLRASAANGFQEEIVGAIEGAGLTPDSADLGQLDKALKLHMRRAALTNWNVVVMTTDEFRAVCYGDGMWLAVGLGGLICTSANGQVWTTQTPAASSTADWRACAYAESLDLFVIAGTDGEIQTSPDGVTWTARTAGSSYAGDFYGAAWIGDKFCLTGESDGGVAYVQTSPTGVTWTRRSVDAVTPVTITSVAYDADNNLAVAVSQSVKRIYTSPDGITWTTRASTADPGFYSVVYNDVLGLWIVSGQLAVILTSPDGITWTARTSPHAATLASYRSACVTPDGVTVLCGFDTDTDLAFVAHSPNGVDWTGVNVYDVVSGGALYGIATDGTRHIAMGGVGGNDYVVRSSGFAG